MIFHTYDCAMEFEKFKSLVEQFLQETGCKPTRFSIDALGDPTFVRRMRKGAQCLPQTQAKVLEYMSNFAAGHGERNS